MKSILALCILSLAVFAVTADDDAGDVIVLNNDNFKNVTDLGSIFVLFYAPWCGHCNSFKPTWRQFASLAKGKLAVGMINCDDSSGICRSYGVRGYPTVLYQHDGKAYKFRSPRTVEHLQKFVDEDYKSAESQDVPTIDYSALDSASDSMLIYIIVAGVVGVVVVLVIICAVCLDSDEPKHKGGHAETGAEADLKAESKEPELKDEEPKDAEPLLTKKNQ